MAVSATGSSSGAVNTSFTVIPTASLSRNDGSVGSNVNVTGEGFPATQLINIIFGGQTVSSVSSGSNGSMNASFIVPSVAAGTYSVNIGAFPPISFRVSSTFTLAPNSGPPGTSVQILGTGFGPSASVNLTIGGTPWQSLVTDEDGELTGTLQIPQLSGGLKTITVSGGGGSATFNVTSTLTVAQLNAAPGDTVEVSGSAFGANESGITVKFAGATVASGIAADSQGNWTASFTVPSTTAGAKSITASGPSSINVPTTSITIGAGITLGESSGPPGSLLRITGSGARSNETLIIDVGGGLASFQATADGNGVWETEITIPAAPKGSLTIRAAGASGEGATATFNVTPTLVLSEPAGPPRSTLIITGEGFEANQSGIDISFDNDIVSSVASDSRGSWTLELTIPPAKKGTYVIKASGGGTEQQASFTVVPGLFISKPRAGPGESITVSGGGFAPNETGFVLKLGETTIASGIAANAKGSWERSFDIPPLPADTYNLTASGAQTSADRVIAVRLTIITSFAAASVSLHQDSADGATGIRVGVDRVFDYITDQNVPALLGAFQVQLIYDGGCINILGVRELDFAIAATKIDNSAGLATFNGFATGGALAPAYLGHALTRMVGSARQNCTVEVTVVDLKDVDGNSVGVSPLTLSLDILRGDARPDGVVDISDVLFIAQYLAGVRAACTATIDNTCLHSVNAASVHQDGAFDQTTIADAMFTAQYLVGSTDEFFNLAPSADVVAELGKEFRLGIGDSAIIESEYLKIPVLEVSEDSRCPADVVCVWEGQATVVADLSARGQSLGPFDLTLRAGRQELATQHAGQYRLTLVGLEPYPISTHPIQPQEYQATLVIYKIE
ncbi:MAG TPA: IPT/TIG domain-containing protein [Dehalococcoidia bacterium]|nr:IPT/TIG domain-containing protein [Dehalococcoidia bacterium]